MSELIPEGYDRDALAPIRETPPKEQTPALTDSARTVSPLSIAGANTLDILTAGSNWGDPETPINAIPQNGEQE